MWGEGSYLQRSTEGEAVLSVCVLGGGIKVDQASIPIAQAGTSSFFLKLFQII